MRRSPPFAALGLAALAVVAAAGCQRRTNAVIPNRVLDRPLDVALACVSSPDGLTVETASLNECAGSISDCGALNTPHLVGFIANSERNEIALFRKCAGALVDMDRETPGYQFIPVGELPSSVSVSQDSCWAAVANYGSCDFSVLDVPGIAAAAVEVEVEGEPASRVATVVPKRADGTPLAARPGQVIAVPRNLSSADGLEGDEPTEGTCVPGAKASVYVTFPACQLVAEVDLQTERILQSRQIVRLPDGGYDVVDTGQSPECPVECAEQFGDDPIPDIIGDPDGVFPLPIALVADPDAIGGTVDPGSTDEILVDSTIFVGGAGSDSLFEIPIEGTTFSQTALQLELSGASGLLGIRPTPTMTIHQGGGAEIYQFLYVIAGDGSTRVVSRDLRLGRDEIGIECDTQVDPSLVTEQVCNEAAYPGDNPPDRRAFAQGPGIRAPNGATVTDWSFQRVVVEESTDLKVRLPFTWNGVVGIGVTNVGRIVFSSFGQFVETGIQLPNETLDPLGTIDLQLLAHSLWPGVEPSTGDPSALPRVEDREPTRILTGETNDANANKVLAPSLRQIDLAYYDPCAAGLCTSPIADESGAALTNADGLGEPENESALYQEAAVKVIARDYREWRGGQWDIFWEGEIPGTSSSTGQLYCDSEGAPPAAGADGGVYCVTENPDGAQLVDASASFCDDGVLAGDKVLIFGCGDTNDCGPGQVCIRDESSDATGICVSAKARDTYGEELIREACVEYISDPCGSPLREFQVSRAFQNRLELQAIDIPMTAYLEYSEDPESGQTLIAESEARMICAPEQPDGGCKINSDCTDEGFGYCIDGLCRGPCEGECVLRRLPGSFCFGELIQYQVRARNSFIVRGPGAYSFLSQRVRADGEGECVEDPTISPLMTSRIRLGADLEETMNNAAWPMPACPPGDIADAPNPCVIVTPREHGISGNTPTLGRLFHYLFYQGEEIPAIRYSNPMFSLIFDLTSVTDLAAPIPGTEVVWPSEMAAFRRSRIPRNYRESFATLTGYSPYNDGAVIGSVPLVGPVRVVNAPETGYVYVVDGSGSGGSGGLRGQVMRIALNPQVLADVDFIVR
ncbi:MAG: hypothetical protein H6710_03595 [Myxococcales bacterium]|nr:hypothetical protein [Myxococcales bacterium]MCB9702650.1 hypothetical protein [Myxococcales bacterium]